MTVSMGTKNITSIVVLPTAVSSVTSTVDVRAPDFLVNFPRQDGGTGCRCHEGEREEERLHLMSANKGGLPSSLLVAALCDCGALGGSGVAFLLDAEAQSHSIQSPLGPFGSALLSHRVFIVLMSYKEKMSSFRHDEGTRLVGLVAIFSYRNDQYFEFRSVRTVVGIM